MEEFKGDKRSKAYRDYKKSFEEEQSKKPDGVGDVVENILHSKPIEPLTNIIKKMIWSDGEDCKCSERKEKLNKIFHFQKPKCLSESEFNYLSDFFSVRRNTVTFQQREELYRIVNRVFGRELKNTNCPSCISKIIRELDAIYKTYK